jgi:hypothetical protein
MTADGKLPIDQQVDKPTTDRKPTQLKGLKANLAGMKEERLTAAQELSIIEGLVYNDGDVKRVAKELKQSIETVSNVAYKYRSKIEDAIQDTKIVDESLIRKSLNTLSDIIHDSLEKLRELQKANPLRFVDAEKNISKVKMLSEQVQQLSKQMADRSQRSKDALRDYHIKLKTVEIMESGKVEDISAFTENKELLINIFRPDTGSIYPRNGFGKPVVTYDISTNPMTRTRYSSLKEASDAHDTDSKYVSRVMKEDKLYKSQFYFVFEENEQQFLDRIKAAQDKKNQDANQQLGQEVKSSGNPEEK